MAEEGQDISSQSAADPGTVEFDVGGETFKVLEQTIRAKPDTLLCTMLDDPGRPGPNQPSKPIFIEANAKLFPFILDWYRSGGRGAEIHGGQDLPLRVGTLTYCAIACNLMTTHSRIDMIISV